MEDYGRPLGIVHSRHRLDMDCLSRRECRHGHLVEVIFGAAVGQAASFVLLQEKGVETIVGDTLLHLVQFVIADNAHQRMKSLKTILLIELLD